MIVEVLREDQDEKDIGKKSDKILSAEKKFEPMKNHQQVRTALRKKRSRTNKQTNERTKERAEKKFLTG
jgi:hypothetical protein